jgi:hypothetical protein
VSETELARDCPLTASRDGFPDARHIAASGLSVEVQLAIIQSHLQAVTQQIASKSCGVTSTAAVEGTRSERIDTCAHGQGLRREWRRQLDWPRGR